MIGEVIFRVFASLFLLGTEWAIYMAVQYAWIRPAADIYIQKCQSQCKFPLSVQVSQIFYALVAITIILSVVYIIMPFTSRTKRPRKVDSEPDTATEE